LPGLGLNGDPSDVCLPSSWDYRYEPLCLAVQLLSATAFLNSAIIAKPLQRKKTKYEGEVFKFSGFSSEASTHQLFISVTKYLREINLKKKRVIWQKTSELSDLQ
jgi:hypothetical protein